MKHRKIIQISESTMVSDIFGDVWNLTALCNDGTVWLINGIRDSDGSLCKWRRLPDIPQDEPKEQLRTELAIIEDI